MNTWILLTSFLAFPVAIDRRPPSFLCNLRGIRASRVVPDATPKCVSREKKSGVAGPSPCELARISLRDTGRVLAGPAGRVRGPGRRRVLQGICWIRWAARFRFLGLRRPATPVFADVLPVYERLNRLRVTVDPAANAAAIWTSEAVGHIRSITRPPAARTTILEIPSPSPRPRPVDQRWIVQRSGVADRLQPRPARVPAPVGHVVERACDWAGVPPSWTQRPVPASGTIRCRGCRVVRTVERLVGHGDPGGSPTGMLRPRPGPSVRRAAARAGRAGRWTGVVVRRAGGGPPASQWPWEGWSACTEGDPTGGRGIACGSTPWRHGDLRPLVFDGGMIRADRSTTCPPDGVLAKDSLANASWVETVYKMTDRQMAAKVQQYFERSGT